MGGVGERAAGTRLLCERAARCHGSGHVGQVRGVFRDDGRSGVCVGGLGRFLGGNCAGSTRGAVGGSADVVMIRVVLPAHLRTLAKVKDEVQLDITGAVTQRSVLDALEANYPMLRGTIRDHVTQQRRPFLRFFACEEDLSHEMPDAALPEAVASGKEPLLIVGAIAGG